MDDIKMLIQRIRYVSPLRGINAVIGYAFFTFNTVVVGLRPELSEQMALINGILALALFFCIHKGCTLWANMMNEAESNHLQTSLNLLNILAEIRGTKQDNDGLTKEPGDDDRRHH